MNRFERFLKNASVRTDETANGRILKMMNDAYGPSARTHRAGRLVRYGIAATILIAVGVVATQMGPFKAGVAWGQVADRVAAEHTFMFSLAIDVSDPNIVKAADQPQARFTFYVSERYGFRLDISGGRADRVMVCSCRGRYADDGHPAREDVDAIAVAACAAGEDAGSVRRP